MALFKIASAPHLRATDEEAGGPLDVSDKMRDLSLKHPMCRTVVCPPNTPDMSYADKDLDVISDNEADDWRI